MISSIYLDSDELKRVEFFDRLLSVGTEELKEVIETEEVIWKLKGNKPPSVGTIKKLIDNSNALYAENVNLQTRIAQLQSDVMALRTDMATLVKVVHNMQQPMYNSEWNTLKQKNGLY